MAEDPYGLRADIPRGVITTTKGEPDAPDPAFYRQGQIGRAQAQLAQAIDNLADALEGHYVRIEPVLGPERPTEAQTDDDYPPCSLIAAGMLRYAGRIERLTGELLATTDRIDI